MCDEYEERWFGGGDGMLSWICGAEPASLWSGGVMTTSESSESDSESESSE